MRLWRALALLLALPAQAEIPLSSLRPLPRPEIAAPPPVALLTPSPALRPLPRPAIANPPRDEAATLPPVRQAANLRPKPRPFVIEAPPPPQPTVQLDASIRRMASVNPPARPAGLAAAAPAPEELAPEEPAPLALASAPQATQPEPQAKPERRSSKRKRESQNGSVCGVAAIKGEEIARITSSVKSCGIAEPVRVTSVSGVRLSQPATLDCDTAKALNQWIEAGLQPAFGRTDVVEMRIAAHYICRSRNNVRGARISEHGRGKAIDIAGVTLENGKTISVLGGYGKELRRAHKAACGIFSTTLGPGSDGFHEDHLHFDTASHRNGPYCR